MEDPAGGPTPWPERKCAHTGMQKYELTKTIEAIKLNKRTLRPLGTDHFTIPYGSILSEVTEDRDRRRFVYLGEYYEADELVIASALRALP